MMDSTSPNLLSPTGTQRSNSPSSGSLQTTHDFDLGSEAARSPVPVRKTEYKSKFTPFDQYAYNEVTDSFVSTRVGVQQALGGQHEGGSLCETPVNGLEGACEPWYKEVVRRNEKANEYRFKSEVGHSSPLLAAGVHQANRSDSPSIYSNSELLSPRQAGSPFAGADENVAISVSDARSQYSDQQSESAQQASDCSNRHRCRFTPSDYKRDHMIAHMANNNNFALPKEAQSSAPRRAQLSSAQARSRSQSNRRQPATSTTTTKASTSTKTTPTKTAAQRQPVASRAPAKPSTINTRTSTTGVKTSSAAAGRLTTTTSRLTTASKPATTTRPTSNGSVLNNRAATSSLSSKRLANPPTRTNPPLRTTTTTKTTTSSTRPATAKQVTPTTKTTTTTTTTTRRAPPTNTKALSSSSRLTTAVGARSNKAAAPAKASPPSISNNAVKSIKTSSAIAAAAAATTAATASAAAVTEEITFAKRPELNEQPKRASIEETSNRRQSDGDHKFVEQVDLSSQQLRRFEDSDEPNLIVTTTPAGNMLADELARAEREAAINARKLDNFSPEVELPVESTPEVQSDFPRLAEVVERESVSSDSTNSTKSTESLETSELPALAATGEQVSSSVPQQVEDQQEVDNLFLDQGEPEVLKGIPDQSSPSSSSASSPSSHSDSDSDSESNKSTAATVGEPEVSKFTSVESEANKPAAVEFEDEGEQHALPHPDLVEQIERLEQVDQVKQGSDLLLEEPDLMGQSLELAQTADCSHTVEATESPEKTMTTTTAALVTAADLTNDLSNDLAEDLVAQTDETVSVTTSEELDDKQQPDDDDDDDDDDDTQTKANDPPLEGEQAGSIVEPAAILESTEARRSSFEAELARLNEFKNDDLNADESRFLVDLSPALESANTTFQEDPKAEVLLDTEDGNIETTSGQPTQSFNSTTEALTAREVSEDLIGSQQQLVEEVEIDTRKASVPTSSVSGDSPESSSSSDEDEVDKLAPGEPDLMESEGTELSKAAPLTLDVTNLIDDIKTLASATTVAAEVDEAEETTNTTNIDTTATTFTTSAAKLEDVGKQDTQATSELGTPKKQSSNSFDSLTEALTAREQDTTSEMIVPVKKEQQQQQQQQEVDKQALPGQLTEQVAVDDLLLADELAPVATTTAALVEDNPELPEARRQPSFSFEAELAKLNDFKNDKGDAIF